MTGVWAAGASGPPKGATGSGVPAIGAVGAAVVSTARCRRRLVGSCAGRPCVRGVAGRRVDRCAGHRGIADHRCRRVRRTRAAGRHLTRTGGLEQAAGEDTVDRHVAERRHGDRCAQVAAIQRPGRRLVGHLDRCRGPQVLTGRHRQGHGTHPGREHADGRGRERRRCRGARTGCRGRGREERLWEQRQLCQPRQRAHHESQPAQRQGHERPHHRRVEVSGGTARQLGPGLDGRTGRLVGADRGEHVEHVRHGDDAAGLRDLGAAQPLRVARTVPLLVVFDDREHAVAQPGGQRCSELGAHLGVQLDDGELFVGQRARLVEDLRRHAQLADVVDERRPAQPIEFTPGEPHLLADHLGVCPHSLRVTAGDPVVAAQRCDEVEQVFGRGRGALLTAAGVPLDPLLELDVRGTVAQRHAISRRRLVGEHQGEVEQRRERQQPAHDDVHQTQDHRRSDRDREQAGHQQSRPRGCRQHPGEHIGGDHRGSERHDDHHRAHEARDPWPTDPPLLSSTARRRVCV